MSAHPNNVVRLAQPISLEPVHVPPGKYRLAYHHHSIAKRFDRDVLEVWFTVADYGEHFRKPLPRYYNVKASAKRRGFTAKAGGEFVRDYCQLFGRRPRFDCAPMSDLKDRLIEARVETVKSDYKQRALPKAMQYSTIRELLGLVG